MRSPRPTAVRTSVLVATLSAAALVVAGTGTAASNPPCKSGVKGWSALCKGTATVRVGSRSTRFSGVRCYVDTAGRPVRVVKPSGLLLQVAYPGRKRRASDASIFAYNGKKVITSHTMKVTLATKGPRGRFSGLAEDGKTPISGSFTCK